MSLFGVEDAPLWSGTPVPAEESPFVPEPKPAPPAERLPLFADPPAPAQGVEIDLSASGLRDLHARGRNDWFRSRLATITPFPSTGVVQTCVYPRSLRYPSPILFDLLPADARRLGEALIAVAAALEASQQEPGA